MPSNVFGVDWLNENANRRFPFADYATLTDNSGTIQIPTELFVDFSLSVDTQAYNNPAGFYLSELAIFGTGISFVIKHGGTEVTRASIPITAPKNTVFYLYGTSSNFGSSIGSFTIGNLEEVKKYGGVFAFSGPTQTGFVVSCIRPDIRGVSAVYVKTGDDLSDPIYGPVVIEAGRNIDIEVSGSTITINAIRSDGFNLDCGVLDRELPDCIRSINMQGPDEGGNIQLQGKTCISIEPKQGFLEFINTCKEPCCTSGDLEALITDLRSLSNVINTQDINVGKLEARITGLERVKDVIESLGFVLPE